MMGKVDEKTNKNGLSFLSMSRRPITTLDPDILPTFVTTTPLIWQRRITHFATTVE
jgi:ribosomal protein S18